MLDKQEQLSTIDCRLSTGEIFFGLALTLGLQTWACYMGAVRTTAITILVVAGTTFLLTLGVRTAATQMVGGAGAPARAGQPGDRGGDTEANKGGVGSSGALRVPCDQVISRVDHYAHSHSAHLSADLSEVAKELGTNVAWVERCMLAYGRRVGRPGKESAASTEQLLKTFEEDEPEEVEREDIDEGLRGGVPERPERQRRLKKASRTPISRDRLD
jgi:hypothetical protein